MFLNKRKMPKKLLYYNALSVRKKLTPEETYIMRALKKGYEGECLYDKIFDEIGHEDIYIMRDIYLKIGASVTQYDSLIITENRVAVNEIKNVSGDYRFENNNWYKDTKQLADNAFAQLSRTKGKLMKLRNDYRLNFDVEGTLIFPNDDFRLSAEEDYIWKETVLRHHMRNYFKQFKREYVGNKADNAARLIKNHIVEDPYFNESADIFDLCRGLYCGQCKAFDLSKGRFQLSCNHCGTVESSEIHLFRAMNDYQMLFQNQPMTRPALLYFIDNQISRTTVYEVMNKHCYSAGKGKKFGYKLKNEDAGEVFKQIRKMQRYKDKIIETEIEG